MSQESQLEEGNGGQLRGETRDEIGSDSQKYRRRSCYCSDIIHCLEEICCNLPHCFLVLLCFLLSPVTFTGKLLKPYYLSLCAIGIIVDPLFFYIPLLNDDKKCIVLDKDLGITAGVLRSFFDFLKLLYIISVLRTELSEIRDKNREIREKYHITLSQFSVRPWVYFFIDILVILPIPQVLLIFRRMGTKYLFAITFFLLQYLLRVIRTYRLSTKAESTWVIVGFNLLLYLHGGQVFGALWYFYAIKKATGCWKKACINHTGCGHSSFHCDDSKGDYSFLNDFCNIKTVNSTNYDFGLFEDALQSGIVEMTDFWHKFLISLRWGLQNLSAFGQNLRTSTDIWENIFAIVITSYGVLLFIFLILKMQADTKRSHKRRLKWEKIRWWPGFYDIPSKDRKEIKKYKHNIWQETERFNIDSLLRGLHPSISRKMKQSLGIKRLKTVNEFEKLKDEWLEDLCDRLKPVFFTARTRIVREGDPIDEMLFVLSGSLRTYTSKNVTIPSSKTVRQDYEYYYDNGARLCGEKLIPWAQEDSLLDLPISTVTIRALTDVEAFALVAEDLKKFFKDLKEFSQEGISRISRAQASTEERTPPTDQSQLQKGPEITSKEQS